MDIFGDAVLKSGTCGGRHNEVSDTRVLLFSYDFSAEKSYLKRVSVETGLQAGRPLERGLIP